MEMLDSRSMPEYFSDLFTYAPVILNDAIHYGDEFERFKLTLKFAFSIIQNLTIQDAYLKRPFMPKPGDTFEAHLIQQELVNIFMECDYVEHEYIDLLSLKDVKISCELPTTYIHIESTGKRYEISGYLSYDSRLKGNNLVISFPGKLKVRFFDSQEGEED